MPSLKLRPGAILDKRFLIKTHIGKGGLSDVYIAQDLVHPPDFVAIKVLKSEYLTDDRFFKSFASEYRILKMLDHPNIVKAIDLKKRKTFCYLALVYVAGVQLNFLLKQHHCVGLPLALARKMIVQVASAVKVIHAKGLVHGDLKPGNLLVDDQGNVTLIDFGLSGLVHDQKQSDIWFDPNELNAVTPAYASPQRLAGHPVQLSDDIFALGCIAYEIICGTHVFEGIHADKAYHAGLSPKVLKTLKRREWQALRQALAFDQEERLREAAFLEHAFSH